MEDNHKKTLSYVHVTAYPEETLTKQSENALLRHTRLESSRVLQEAQSENCR